MLTARFGIRRTRLLAAVVVAALGVGQSRPLLAQPPVPSTEAPGSAARLPSISQFVEREAARLATPRAGEQFGQPGQPQIGGPGCTKKKAALIGAIIGATTTGIVLLQAESNRRSGQPGYGAGTVLLILAIGAGGGALAGAAAC